MQSLDVLMGGGGVMVFKTNSDKGGRGSREEWGSKITKFV